MKILIINGPNLNLLGKNNLSEHKSLYEISKEVNKKALFNKFNLFWKQYNSEDKIIKDIHLNNFDIIIGNLSSYSLNGYAIYDAILAVNKPFYEVSISGNIISKDLSKSVFKNIAIKQFAGLNEDSYIECIDYIKDQMLKNFSSFKQGYPNL